MRRGPHKKKEKRTYRITLRLTEFEYSVLSEDAAKSNQPLAVYTREQALKVHGILTAPIQVDTCDLRPLVTEYSRIGNNLNQIARYFNTDGMKSQEIESEIKLCIAQLFQLRTKTMKMEEIINGNLKTQLK